MKNPARMISEYQAKNPKECNATEESEKIRECAFFLIRELFLS